MNCDDAFECMTTLTAEVSDLRTRELERHLESCPRCRQMREVLAPATQLLAGTDSLFVNTYAESRPANTTGAMWSEVARVEAAVRREVAAPTIGMDSQKHQRWAGWIRSIGCIALGACLAIPWVNWAFSQSLANPVGEIPICNRLLASQLKNVGGTSQQAAQLAASCVACHQPSPPILHQ